MCLMQLKLHHLTPNNIYNNCYHMKQYRDGISSSMPYLFSLFDDKSEVNIVEYFTYIQLRNYTISNIINL